MNVVTSYELIRRLSISRILPNLMSNSHLYFYFFNSIKSDEEKDVSDVKLMRMGYCENKNNKTQKSFWMWNVSEHQQTENTSELSSPQSLEIWIELKLGTQAQQVLYTAQYSLSQRWHQSRGRNVRC